MKFSLFLLAATAGTSLAYPGMGNLMRELAERQATSPPNVTIEMIGDLQQGATTTVGNQIKNCLLGTGPCQDLTPKVRISSNSNAKANLLDIQSTQPNQPRLFPRHL